MINRLDIKNSTVSIDAIGCQKDIAKTIRAKEAQYFLSVKKNQGELFEQISESFKHHKVIQGVEEWEYDAFALTLN